jgi:hypothetical protein
MGPYLRMGYSVDGPDYGLLSLPNICLQCVLYPDADAVLPNRITHSDMQTLKSYMTGRNVPIQTITTRPLRIKLRSIWNRFRLQIQPQPSPIIMYGRESHWKGTIAQNTGVPLMDVDGFRRELPRILQFRQNPPGPIDLYSL